MPSKIPGSEHPPPEGARPLGWFAADEGVDVSVYVRPILEKGGAGPLRARLAEPRRVSREEYRSLYGAHDDDVSKLEVFGRDHGLEVLETNSDRRVVVF